MTAPVRITDHALVRFMERAGGLDTSALRTLLQESLKRAAIAAGKIDSADYTVAADGLIYVVENGTLITIKERPQRRPRRS